MAAKALEELLEKKEEYKKKILELANKPVRKVAYHFNCPDGLISAALVKFLFPNERLVFIPLDYAFFKDEKMVEGLADSDWFAIVDLEPFNHQPAEYFIDHHISNVNKKFNATNVYFVAGAPSAAYLIERLFYSKLPEYLKELVRISTVTDTANYKIPAPLEINEDPSKMSWDEKIWFLQDVCKSSFTIEEHDELLEILSFEGWNGLLKNHLIERVKRLRNKRKISKEIAQKIIFSDFVIIIDKPLHYNLAYIASDLQKRGALGVGYITVYPSEIKLSFRLSKALSPKEVDKYRVDLLANTMGGGGHKPASGAEMSNLEEALIKINSWAKKKGLKINTVDLREK
ncbi:MAG: hypothetical protein ACFFDS_00395 [Candidatus Thorarchaeota archaeon]